MYKYDVVISFTEEDKNIALAIATALKACNLRYYYYLHQPEVTLGHDLEMKLDEVYSKKSRLALALISQAYLNKKYTQIEYNAILRRYNQDKQYLIPLKVDNTSMTSLKGMSEGIAYLQWKDFNDPFDLIEIIINKLKQLPSDSIIDTNNYNALLHLSRQELMNNISQSQNSINTSFSKAKDYFSLGVLLLHTGEYQKALANFDKVLQMDMGIAKAYYFKAIALVRGRRIGFISHKKAKEIEECIQMAISLDSQKHYFYLFSKLLIEGYYEFHGLYAKKLSKRIAQLKLNDLEEDKAETRRLYDYLKLNRQ